MTTGVIVFRLFEEDVNHLNRIYLYELQKNLYELQKNLYELQKILIFFETRYFLIYYLNELAHRQIKNCELLSSGSPYNI